MLRVALVQALALALIIVVVRPAPVAARTDSPSDVAYQPPVDGPVVDPFRPPPEPWAKGNRGIDYATTPGTPVRSAADGEVVFAGQVGGSLHVVVLHADGIRTSYSFLASVTVHRGDRVRQGQPVGTAGSSLHFGARAGDTYIDPTSLFGNGLPRVFLVPDDERRPRSEAAERSGLLGSLADLATGVAGATSDAVAWARDTAAAAGRDAASRASAEVAERIDELRGLAHDAWDLNPVVRSVRVLGTVADYENQLHDCTPAEVPPPHLSERHLAVEVAGLDSTSDDGRAAITKLDTVALGYAPDDVLRFSYAPEGGTTREHAYTGDDTTVDLRLSAAHLRQLLERLAEEHPGVPIDVFAHSQGGLVARAALAFERDAGDGRLPRVSSVVMIGTPNTGADLATALTLAGHTGPGPAVLAGVAALPDHGDPRGPSLHQLSEASTFLDRLDDRPLPPDVHVTSIGARGDVVVPARHTHLDGAHNIVVSLTGLASVHSDLPGSPEVRREVALAVAGMPPTCRSLLDMLTDEFVSDTISSHEDLVGLAAWAGGRSADLGAPLPVPRREGGS